MTTSTPAPADSTTPTSPPQPIPSLVERLTQLLSNSVTAHMVYGEPVSANGVTIVPVARAVYGLGGGSGSSSPQRSGNGGGAGVVVTPVGYIELTDGGSRFRPIRPSVVPLVAISGLVALLLLRSVPKLLRRRSPE